MHMMHPGTRLGNASSWKLATTPQFIYTKDCNLGLKYGTGQD